MHVGTGPFDDLVDAALAPLLRRAFTPVLVLRARRRLRGPGRSLRCELRPAETAVPGWPAAWRDGVATLSPGRLTFRTGAGATVDLQVLAVVETTATRTRGAGDPGPYRLGVVQLRTQFATVLWSAHRTLLAEGAAVLRGDA